MIDRSPIHPSRRRRRRSGPARAGRCLLATLGVLVLAAGLAGCGAGSPAGPSGAVAERGSSVTSPAPPATSDAPITGTGSTPDPATDGEPGTGSTSAGVGTAGDGPDPIAYPTGIEPVAIEIPTIGVSAPIIELGLAGEEPEVPADFGLAGWYRQTRRPGEIGPAVIAGHIDSVDGPAVFARLDELRAGDEIVVLDRGGDRRRFVVERSGQYPKGDLPDEVFGFDRPVPELRLITCGGSFDRSSGHYRDNHVVYATLADPGNHSSG